MSLPEQQDFFERPPLGPLRDLNAEDEARSAEAAALSYVSLASNEVSLSRFHELNGHIRAFQQSFGATPAGVNIESVHVLKQDDMDRAVALVSGEPDVRYPAFYDPRTDISYVGEPEGQEPLDQIMLWYAICHEIGHKITPAILDSQNPKVDMFTIMEGVADRIAQGYVHRVLLPKGFPEVADVIGGTTKSYVYNGLFLRQSELVYIDPATQGGVGLARLEEVRAVEALEARLGQVAYRRFMQLAMGASSEAIESHLINNLSLETWRTITADPEQVTASDVVKVLSK